MNLIEQIDRHDYLHLVEISEPAVNVLRVVIDEAKAGAPHTDVGEVWTILSM